VTVALDVHVDDARPFIEAAKPEHPSLIDASHVTDELLGFVNVPNGVWIDEQGMIVRPAEPAFPGRNPMMDSFRDIDLDTVPEEIRDVLAEARKIKTEPERYAEMVRDWAANGAASEFALTADEVLRRCDPRGDAEATAAAHFELGEYLHRNGNHAGAVPHWQEAHHLYPANWTYKRQAWNIEDPVRQGRTDVYDSSWYEDVQKIGAENYYPPVVP
jgi:hypothetical protein